MFTQEKESQVAPHIRTFHPRRGRIGAGRAQALARLWPQYGYEIEPGGPPFDAAALFGRRAPLVIEIGCGMGEAVAAMAASDPGRDYLGVDVHTPGLANLLATAERGALRNVRAARGDAVELLRDLLAPDSLDAVHVFFPDPWPKARHHKRRIIRSDVVALIRGRLRPDGTLRCATDWAPYAARMLEVLTADAGLSNRHAGYAPRPGDRPQTKFERRALAAGRPVFDLEFTRR
ncbi:tRNA (guanosine(46)-N7)-methyltransferase TrmB [Actinocrinis puniceicyclus]|uniref:tRNA (guanine-N(7)-)-methyltransferase n=1 Tax=Actinocrinis puniceicyclus TaxID=977794 RepID=A0A8J7WLG0_9ACTN|nr:tRNA (guanosine(46)-N7)-methyltransferase TrmB [Actinocrinis puniceicyclus]MBS2961669.1 tRNA (guanosine(46)-N7)-methyltransferase TrmB [Actinocrinis puniceicyclus]